LLAKRRAVAAPIPADEPVTTQTLGSLIVQFLMAAGAWHWLSLVG